MKLILVTILTFSCIFAYQNTDEYINEINSKQNSWKAGRNYYNGKLMTHMHTLPYAKMSHIEKTLNYPVKVPAVNDVVPDTFDARTKWPKCTHIGLVPSEGACAASSALSVAAAASERVCIHSDGKLQPMLSGQQLLACTTNNTGCLGFHPFSAWIYWKNNGLVSGGPYNTSVGCQPYTIAPCEHYIHGSKPDCPENPVPTPTCEKKCSSPSIKYEEDLVYGGEPYGLPINQMYPMLNELFKNGPFTAWITVYKDLFYYKSGVYHTTEKTSLGYKHTVRIIGWGVENGTMYWLAVNTWNEDWGDKGLIKIRRDTNECDIETYAFAALPK